MNKSKKQANYGGTAFPPMYSSQPQITRKLRFQATSGVVATSSIPITRAQMINLVLAVKSTETDAYPVLGAVRLDRVQIWGIGSSGVSSVTLLWNGNNSNEVEKTDTGNQLKPAHISMAPPAKSFAEMWTSDASDPTETLFEVRVQTGDIVDLSLSIVMRDGAVAPVTLPGAATINGIVYSSLDGAGDLLPVSLTYSGL